VKHVTTHITILCGIAKVSTSGYYKWLKTVDEPNTDHDDYLLVKEQYEKGKQKWGWRTIQMKLHTQGVCMNHKKIIRIMRKYGLTAKIRKQNPYKAIMKKTQEHRVHDNLLDRQFGQETPDTVYSTDITYLPFRGKFAYLSPVKDLATREIISWQVSLHIDMTLVLNTMQQLKQRRRNSATVIHTMIHSDQGAHYTSPQYAHMIKHMGMVQSMSRKGNCIDNAPIESFFGHFKDEIDYTDCKTFEALKQRIDEYMDYYNNHRPQWSLNKMTPAQYRSHLLIT